MKMPSSFLQKAQYDYIDSKYKDGVNVFPSLDNLTIEVIVKSFLSWAEQSGHISEDKLDLSFLEEKSTKKKA